MSDNDPTVPPSQPPQPPVPPVGYGFPQQPYPQQPYGGYPQYGYPQQRGTNGFAIASLICAFLCWPLGLVFGFVARNQIKERGDSGDGLALAGIIISFVGLAITIVYIILVVAVVSHTNFNVYIPPQPT